ncbi:hypothetical protein VPHD479_0137 [Vibrio phage D479]
MIIMVSLGTFVILLLSFFGFIATVDMIDNKQITIANLLLSAVGFPGTLFALVIWVFSQPFMNKPL